MKKWIIGLIIAIIIVFGLWKAYQPQPIELQGRVEADAVHVTTKLVSRIEEIYVHEGQVVKKGQPLAQLNSPEIDAKKQQALASLQSALALKASTDRGTREENVESLYANWQSLKAQQALAQTTYQRSQNLYQEGVISRQRRDESFAAQRSSQELTEAAYQQYKKAKIGSTHEQKSVADAQVDIAQAAVKEANSLETETKLYAPIDGTVSHIFGQSSELVLTGVPVVTLIDTQHLWVSLNVQEDQYAHIKNTLQGYVPALDKTLTFHVKEISPQGEFATIKSTRQTDGYDIRSFKFHLTTSESGLKEGMSVVFKIQDSK